MKKNDEILKNFEIPFYLEKRIKKYSNFLGFNKTTMMGVLFGMGYRAYQYNPRYVVIYNMMENQKDRNRAKRNRAKKKIEDIDQKISGIQAEIKEIQGEYRTNIRQKIEKCERDIAELIDQKNEITDKLEKKADKIEGIFENEKKKQKIRDFNGKREKISITESQNKFVGEIVEEFNGQKGRKQKYYESDIIYSFIMYGLKNLEYISVPKYGDVDLLEDPDYACKKKIQFEIPNAFYKCLQNRAEQFNVSVRDYMIILVEEKFDEDKELMRKIISKEVSKRGWT